MTIISVEKVNGIHLIESQSHRDSIWLDGFISVPPDMCNDVIKSRGYCDLIIEGNTLVSIKINEIPADPKAEKRNSASSFMQGVFEAYRGANPDMDDKELGVLFGNDLLNTGR